MLHAAQDGQLLESGSGVGVVPDRQPDAVPRGLPLRRGSDQ